MVETIEFLRKRGIFYLERPVAKEEKKVAEILQLYYDLLGSGNLDSFLSLFSKGARIQSYISDREIISKEEYIKKMKANFIQIWPLSFYDALIRIISNNRAELTTSLLFRFVKTSQSKILTHRAHFEFIKDEESNWKIFRYSILD